MSNELPLKCVEIRPSVHSRRNPNSCTVWTCIQFSCHHSTENSDENTKNWLDVFWPSDPKSGVLYGRKNHLPGLCIPVAVSSAKHCVENFFAFLLLPLAAWTPQKDLGIWWGKSDLPSLFDLPVAASSA